MVVLSGHRSEGKEGGKGREKGKKGEQKEAAKGVIMKEEESEEIQGG